MARDPLRKDPALSQGAKPLDIGLMETLLAKSEAALHELAVNLNDEKMSASVAGVLRNLAALRMEIEQPGPNDKRSGVRFPDPAAVVLETPDGDIFLGALHDISSRGALVEVDGDTAVGQRFSLRLPGLIQEVAATAVAVGGDGIRLSFNDLPADAVVALLKHIERHLTRY